MILFIKHVPIEGPGMLGCFFEEKDYEIEILELSKGDNLPEEMGDIEAVVTLGGPMNVYEEKKYSFLKAEDIFIKRILCKNIPFLGVCLGAQLLAKAAGASVKKASRKEIGFYEVDKTREGRNSVLFEGLPDKFQVFQWHEDKFNIPADGVPLAVSDIMEYQAVRVGNNAYGLQFHLEVDKKAIEEWLQQYLDECPGNYQKSEKILKQYNMVRNKFRENGEIMCRNFERVVREFKYARVEDDYCDGGC